MGDPIQVNCFAIPLGAAVAVGTRTGVEMGAGRPAAAKRALATGLCLSLGVQLLISLAVLFGRDAWMLVYGARRDAATAALVVRFTPILCYVTLNDSGRLRPPSFFFLFRDHI